MNYSALFKNFAKEVSASVQYNEIAQPFKAFAIVATLPFWILYFVYLCLKYVGLFMFNCLASSSDYLESWVKDTKKDVNPITEAVIYFVTTPFIFLLRCLLSVFSVIFYMIWFVSMCVGYICSLGGIRWQPFISSAKYEGNEKIRVTTNRIAAQVIIMIAFVLFCLYMLLQLIGLVAEDYDIMQAASIVDMIYTAFTVIAVPITFRKVVYTEDEAAVAAEASAEDTTDASAAAEDNADGEFEEEFPDF